jgi:hypothetical protein
MDTISVNSRDTKRIPKVGDRYILGLTSYMVMGYAPDTKSLMYARTYADRRDPLEVPVKELKALDPDQTPCWWVNKARVSGGRKIWFNVEFQWHTGKIVMQTKAVSLKEARQNAMYRIGHDLCNIDTEYSSAAAIQAAKDGLANAAHTTFSDHLLIVKPILE